ncbi:hypothetical protein S83_054893, partial [Arachis hypogaea]
LRFLNGVLCTPYSSTSSTLPGSLAVSSKLCMSILPASPPTSICSTSTQEQKTLKQNPIRQRRISAAASPCTFSLWVFLVHHHCSVPSSSLIWLLLTQSLEDDPEYGKLANFVPLTNYRTLHMRSLHIWILDSSFVAPLVYAFMGTSRDIAIELVAV